MPINENYFIIFHKRHKSKENGHGFEPLTSRSKSEALTIAPPSRLKVLVSGAYIRTTPYGK